MYISDQVLIIDPKPLNQTNELIAPKPKDQIFDDHDIDLLMLRIPKEQNLEQILLVVKRVPGECQA